MTDNSFVPKRIWLQQPCTNGHLFQQQRGKRGGGLLATGLLMVLNRHRMRITPRAHTAKRGDVYKKEEPGGLCVGNSHSFGESTTTPLGFQAIGAFLTCFNQLVRITPPCTILLPSVFSQTCFEYWWGGGRFTSNFYPGVKFVFESNSKTSFSIRQRQRWYAQLSPCQRHGFHFFKARKYCWLWPLFCTHM